MDVISAIFQQLRDVCCFALELLLKSCSDLLERGLARFNLRHLLSHTLVLFLLLLDRDHHFGDGLDHFELEIVNSVS